MTANVRVVRTFKDLYPFEGTDDRTPGAPHCRMSAISSYQKELINRITRYTSDRNLLFIPFRSVAGKYDAIVNNANVGNFGTPIVRLDNGSYTYIFPYADSSGTWTNVQTFATWLNDRHIPFLHLLPPYKFDDRITTFPSGVPHGYAQMVAEYQQFISEKAIPCLDAQRFLLAKNSDFQSWFYTLHLHATAYAGLTIAQSIARALKNEMGIATDVESVEPENFTQTVYPKAYRANWAAGITTPTEDVEVYYPHEDGFFHVEVPNLGLAKTGGFHDTLLSQSRLKSATHCHNAFLYGPGPLIQVENLTCTNHTRILVIRRCDSSVIWPYLACTVRHLDILYPSSFDGSIRTFIKQTKPDVVIICSYMQTHANDSFWRLR